MDEGRETLEVLETRHRREQRELVAQLTALKKTVSKGDKKQKKEIQVEMARREAELDARHAQEKEAWEKEQQQQEEKESNTNESDTPVNQHDNDDNEKEEEENTSNIETRNQPKKSKQQRRKEKKQAELRRMEEEAEEEAAQQVDMQKVEMSAILELLNAMKLKLVDITADGHCLYNALADQLNQQHSIKADCSMLRQQAAKFIQEHRDDFIPFLTNAQGDMLDQNELDDYCNRLANTAEWGGHAEILALSRVYQLPVHIVQMGAPVMKISEEFPSDRPLRISYHRYAYGLGEHYNSLHSSKS